MIVQNYIKLNAAVHKLSCQQRNSKTKKNCDDDENNRPTVIDTADSNISRNNS